MHRCGCRQVSAFEFHLFFLSGFLSILTKGDVCSCQQYTCNTCPLSCPCTRSPACLAVNGNTATTFITATSNNPACVHTADGDVTPHWEVDLGGQYAISSITVYGRKENGRNMLRNTTVTVDNKLCYSFAPDYRLPVITEITCSQPLTGSKVRFQKAYTTDLIFLALCQVQVWVCNDSYYGPNCANTCGRCSSGTCDPWSGECLQGCSAGYQAPDCKENRDCTSCAVPVVGAVVGSCAVCTLAFLLAILLIKYRHHQELNKRPSTARFSSPLQTGPEGARSFEPVLSTNYENTTVSTNVYDPLTASRDNTVAYTTLAVKRTGDVSSLPYANTT